MKRTTGTGGRIVRFSAIFFLALITVSCATAGHKEGKTKQSFRGALEAFNDDVRWQDFESAAAFVPKGQKERYWKEMDRMKHDIRLTDFEVRDIEFSDHDRSAKAIVHYQYWRVDSPLLRSDTFTQTWRYYGERKGTWKVTDTGFTSLTGASSGF